MFTWICPQCGKEVPPHETECPHCKEASQAKERAEEVQPAPAGTLEPAAPQQAAAAAPPQAPQQPVYYVGAKKRTPAWVSALLVTVLVAGGLTGIGYLVYKYGLKRGETQAATTTESPFEPVPSAGESTGATGVAKYVEATGFRITEDANKRLQIQFLIVNHSGADLGDLAGTVHLKTTESDKDLASVDFKTTRLGPYESVEFKAIVSTTLRAYELPDWQFLRSTLEISSPSGLR